MKTDMDGNGWETFPVTNEHDRDHKMARYRMVTDQVALVCAEFQPTSDNRW